MMFGRKPQKTKKPKGNNVLRMVEKVAAFGIYLLKSMNFLSIINRVTEGSGIYSYATETKYCKFK